MTDVAVDMDKDVAEDEEAKVVIMKRLEARLSSMFLKYQTQPTHSQHRNGKLCSTMEAKHM